MPGILTWRGLRLPLSATRSTWAMTMPPELCAAIAMASASSVSASFSMVRLPSASPVVARMIPTWIGEGLVGEAFLAAERHPLDEVLGGLRVELAAAVLRIDEGLHADAGDMRGTMRGDVAEEVGDDALRQVVGLDGIVDRHLLELRHKPPVTADHPLDQALMGEMVETLGVAVALPGRKDQREPSRTGVGREGNAPRARWRSLRRSRCRRSRRSRPCRRRG